MDNVYGGQEGDTVTAPYRSIECRQVKRNIAQLHKGGHKRPFESEATSLTVMSGRLQQL